jgi:hypothetical protein
VPGQRAAFVILAIGVITFGAVFSLLEFSLSRAEPAEVREAEVLAVTPTPLLAAPDSLAPRLRDGRLAVGVPVAGSEPLLRDVQPGDRLDVVASLPAPPVTAVVVRGATVLRPPNATDPLVLDVSAADAIALAHLTLSGTHLGFVLWPADAVASPESDLETAQSLGVSPTPTSAPPVVPSVVPTLLPPTRAPPALPTLPPATVSGFLYQVQPGDSWSSIAATFGMSTPEVLRWNEVAANEDPVPGRLVFIPRAS